MNNVTRKNASIARAKDLLTVVLVVCVGSLASLLGFYEARNRDERLFRADFEARSEDRVSTIGRGIDGDIAALDALRGFASLPGALTGRNFEDFAGRLLESYPSLHAVEWVPRVSASGRADFEAGLKRDGVPNPRITEGRFTRAKLAAARPEYFPVRFVFPRNQANHSEGFDLASCGVCRLMLDQAASTGEPTASAMFSFAGKSRGSVVVAAPVYRARAMPAAPDQRRAQVGGYALIVVEVGDLVERAVEDLHPQGINIQLYDQSAAAGSQFLYFHRARVTYDQAAPLPEDTAVTQADNRYMQTLTLGSRRWLAVCTPTTGYLDSAITWRPWGVLLAGLLLTLAAWGLVMLHGVHGVRTARLTSQLAEARDQALEASRLKSQFLANISHATRTPMNGVIGFADLLLGTPLSPVQREYAETVRESGQELIAVLSDILDLSKIEAGRLEIEPVSFDLKILVEEVRARLLPRAREKGLKLRTAYAAEVPRRVIGDAGHIRQILINLASNAIKFTSQGHVMIEVNCETPTAPKTEFLINVEDNGIGIPREKLGLLFEKFSQLDNALTSKQGGTGLGLAIAKRLVDLMGGTIGVNSSESEGSTFWFTLPLELDMQPMPVAEPKSRSAAQPHPPSLPTSIERRAG